MFGFLLSWSAGKTPTLAKHKETVRKHVPAVSEEDFESVFRQMVQSRKVMHNPETDCLWISSLQVRRLRFTPARAVGFVFGGLAAAYSPITQVSHLRVLVGRVWPAADNYQTLYDAVVGLRRGGHVVSNSRGDDFEQWYLSLPKEAVELDMLTATT